MTKVKFRNSPKFWRNEFSWLNTQLKNHEESEKEFGAVVREYARYCTLHGIQYIFKENLTFIERSVWFVITLSSFICASLLVNTMWTRYSMSPTMTAVKDTHFPLYSIPFPAVSVCSTDKIKKETAYMYLSKYVNVSDEKVQVGVDNFLSAMTLFQLPLYSRMTFYLQNAYSLLPTLSLINLTDFMLQVMPKCEDTFNRCFWIGKPIDCCELFNLQRTEEGFCYSFNSITSDRKCKLGRAGSFSEFSDEETCPLKRNTAAGSSSGLEVFLKAINESSRVNNAAKIIGASGYRIQAFYVAEYPEAGMGSLVESKKGTKMMMTLKPSVTTSTEAIRHLSINDRFCYFPDEKRLSISPAYSQKSCLIECRLKHLKKICNCRPYFFNMQGELVFFSPPNVEIRGFNDSDLNSLLNCSQCLPTCHETVYDIDTAFAEDTLPLAQASYGALDIFYRNEGAVKYQRDVTFGWTDLLVSFGGIAGLFLGFSLLTIVEFLYWSIKLIAHQIATYVQSHKFAVNSIFVIGVDGKRKMLN